MHPGSIQGILEKFKPKKVLQVSSRLQKDDVSSMANNTPPIGAPKAAEIPAAAPLVMKSLCSLSLLKRSKMLGKRNRRVLLFAAERPAPIMLPMWTIGPSEDTFSGLKQQVHSTRSKSQAGGIG